MKCDATALRVLYDDGRCYINNSFKVTKTFGLRPQTRVVLTLIINASLTSLHLQLFQNIFHFPPEPNNILLRSRVRAAK